MYDEWEDIEYALLDRTITVIHSVNRWRASIKINDITFDGIGLTPGMAVDNMTYAVVRHKERNPTFIIARQDVKN